MTACVAIVLFTIYYYFNKKIHKTGEYFFVQYFEQDIINHTIVIIYRYLYIKFEISSYIISVGFLWISQIHTVSCDLTGNLDK